MSAGAEPFVLRSPDLRNGGRPGHALLGNANGCNGGNRSPALSWSGAPAGTKSYAITWRDADAPPHGGWHWAIVNIPGSVTRIGQNASASGELSALGASQARNDFHDEGYTGPCPQPGAVHRYVIEVYAIKDAQLRVVDGRPAPFFEHEIAGSVLGHASMTVFYGR